jgi:hypothetical protein
MGLALAGLVAVVLAGLAPLAPLALLAPLAALGFAPQVVTLSHFHHQENTTVNPASRDTTHLNP